MGITRSLCAGTRSGLGPVPLQIQTLSLLVRDAAVVSLLPHCHDWLPLGLDVRTA